MQFGHSKDDPSRPQIKVMTGSLDPLGLPLATDVLSGERADDGLYIPLIERIEAGVVKVNQISTGLALQAPFGGVKKSSTDSFKEQGAGAIEFYTKLKTVYLDYSA